MTSVYEPFLAGAKSAAFPHFDRIAGAPTPRVPTDAVTFIADAHRSIADDESLDADAKAARTAHVDRLMNNTVKKCPACGKVNGFTLAACNGCGGPLGSVEVSQSTNVFMCFVLGIQRGPFPMTVSLRAATPEAMVIDDLLALSPLHFNAIPTTHHIPDWRHLLRHPARGLALVRSLLLQCNTAAQAMLADAAVAAKLLPKGKTAADVTEATFLSGFNFPPSQFQLHIQFMLPALVPFHEHQVRRGVHFTHGRFFPTAYVVRCLELAAADPLPPALLLATTPVEDITRCFAERGLDYNTHHAAMLKHAEAAVAEFSPWKAEDFEGRMESDASGAGLKFVACGGPTNGAPEAQAVVDQDKLALQNYGRPYSDGRPSGSYYPYARSISEVDEW